MRYLIVNGDDFGASRGINRGIVEAHEHGILTSASLLVHGRGSEEAAALCRALPALSVGLHVEFPAALPRSGTPPDTWLPGLLREQYQQFERLMGRPPTHLDSHRNVHREPAALACFLELAAREGLPLREHSPVRHFPHFYGQWDGVTHGEQISVEKLAQMLTQLQPGITELACHPGYVDGEFATSYAAEREVELRTLTHPLLRRVLQDEEIHLVSFHQVDALLATAT